MVCSWSVAQVQPFIYFLPLHFTCETKKSESHLIALAYLKLLRCHGC